MGSVCLYHGYGEVNRLSTLWVIFSGMGWYRVKLVQGMDSFYYIDPAQPATSMLWYSR